MSKIYLVISRSDDSKFRNEYWKEALENSTDFEVKIIECESIHHDYDLEQDVLYKLDQTEVLIKLFTKNKIGDGDIILFTDSWHYGIIPLSYLRKKSKKNVRFIGFWGDSYFTSVKFKNGQFYNKVGEGTNWAKQFEKGIINALDYNCFADFNLGVRFRIRYFPLMVYNPGYFIGYPFEYIRKVFDSVDLTQKENLIVFMHPMKNEMQKTMITQLNSEFPEFKFVFPDELKMSRANYLDLLRRAKIVFIADKENFELTPIWEAMCHGCIPFVPTQFRYKEYLPEKYRYQDIFKESKRPLTFLRKKFYISDKIKECLEEYTVNVTGMVDDIDKIQKQFYNTKRFLDIINGNDTDPYLIKSEKRYERRRKFIKHG